MQDKKTLNELFEKYAAEAYIPITRCSAGTCCSYVHFGFVLDDVIEE